MKKNEHMDLARSRFSDFISVSHDECISHENRTCGIFGNYLCNDFLQFLSENQLRRLLRRI